MERPPKSVPTSHAASRHAPSHTGWRLLGVFVAACVLGAGCHLALGLESASELETTTTVPTECDDGTPSVECEDENPCTRDECVQGKCRNIGLDEMAATDLQTAGDCQLAVCRAGVLEETNDDTDSPDDGDPCTADACSLGAPDFPPAQGGTTCASGVCNGAGACTECFDQSQCTAPDTCGGGATPFECGCTPLVCSDVGLTCGNAPNGCVGALNCNTAMKDGSETDVDCGGDTNTCSRRCSAGQACLVPGDCLSMDCSGNACVGN